MKFTDIDIDMADRNKLLSLIQYVDASMINKESNIIKKHNVGIYLQEIPTFLDTSLSSIDYNDTGQYGYFKLDVLNNSIYESVKDEAQLDRLLATEPDWDLLLDANIVPSLFQIGRHYYMLCKWKPKSILQLAMFIAMIRPSKKHLLNCNSWDEVEKEIWIPPEDTNEAYFKKSHSIAYANVLRVQMNLINNP